MSAYLTAILNTKNGKLLGYQFRGPSYPDPFASGKLGNDRMVSVLYTSGVGGDTFSKCMNQLIYDMTKGTARLHFLDVVARMKADGDWPGTERPLHDVAYQRRNARHLADMAAQMPDGYEYAGPLEPPTDEQKRAFLEGLAVTELSARVTALEKRLRHYDHKGTRRAPWPLPEGT